MHYREFGRTGWKVSDIGYGMWGMGSWSGSDDQESLRALQRAVDLGCNFFDTAFAYGNGRSESLLGQLVRANPSKKIYTATKIPPKNMQWPALPENALEDCYPPDHVEEFLHKSLENAGLDSFDLLQLHTWNDDWATETGWADKFDELKKQGLISACGISINRWEPWNGIKAVRSGKIDSVQVIYNIFDQTPERNLFPLCEQMNLGVLARVPLDEGGLTGAITPDTHFEGTEFRAHYFRGDRKQQIVEHVEALKRDLKDVPGTLPEIALRFCLSNRAVSSVIPGMRRIKTVESSCGVSDAGPLPENVLAILKRHAWYRNFYE